MLIFMKFLESFGMVLSFLIRAIGGPCFHAFMVESIVHVECFCPLANEGEAVNP